MKIKAINLPKKLKIKEIIKNFRYKIAYKTNYEVVYEVGSDGWIVLYSFGVLVFVNTSKKYEVNVLGKVQDLAYDKFLINDSYEIEVKPEETQKVEHSKVTIRELNLDYLRVISLILAESVAMEAYEEATEKILAKSLEYSNKLSLGKYPTKDSELLKFIGFSLTTRQEILSNLYISSLPDEAWDKPELEHLFLQLKDMFDIEPRYRTLNMSLNAIQESIEIIVDLLQNKKSLNLELWIVLLIVFEVLLSIVEHIV